MKFVAQQAVTLTNEEAIDALIDHIGRVCPPKFSSKFATPVVHENYAEKSPPAPLTMTDEVFVIFRNSKVRAARAGDLFWEAAPYDSKTAAYAKDWQIAAWVKV